MSQYQMNMRPAFGSSFGSRPPSFGATGWGQDFWTDSGSIGYMKDRYYANYERTPPPAALADYSSNPLGMKTSVENWVKSHPPSNYRDQSQTAGPGSLEGQTTQPSANNMAQQPNQQPVGVINGQTIQLPSQAPSSSFGAGVGVPAKPWYMVPTNQAYLALAALAVIGAVVYSQQRR